MFNVKFVNFYDSNENHKQSTHGISCSHYAIDKFENRFEVTCYPNMTDVGGVTRKVLVNNSECPEGVMYQACYIENSKGKTIEHVSQSTDHVQSLDC